jgi:hypothetical protein
MTTVRAALHHRPSAETINPEIEPNGCAPVVSGEEALQRSHYLVRRIFIVLADLGLRETLPADWVVPTADGVDFGLLSFKDAARLALTLESLIRDGRPQRPAPGPDQLSLFGRNDP